LAGWSASLEGALPWNESVPFVQGANIVTSDKDQRDKDPNALVSSPFGLWRELNERNVACGGWFLWPPAFKDLPRDTFALVVGFNWPLDKCSK